MNRQCGQPEVGQFLRDTVEAAANGFDRQVEEEGDQRADDEHDERPRRAAQQRNALGQPVVGKQEGKTGAG